MRARVWLFPGVTHVMAAEIVLIVELFTAEGTRVLLARIFGADTITGDVFLEWDDGSHIEGICFDRIRPMYL